MLEMCGWMEAGGWLDGEGFSPGAAGALTADLWREIARPDVRKHRECREAVKIRHAHAYGRPVNLRIFPSDREEDGRVAERAEVIRVVCVLPQVVGIDDHELSKGLLEAGVELVALAGANRRLQARATDHIGDDRVTRAQACQDQVLVERRLQDA